MSLEPIFGGADAVLQQRYLAGTCMSNVCAGGVRAIAVAGSIPQRGGHPGAGSAGQEGAQAPAHGHVLRQAHPHLHCVRVPSLQWVSFCPFEKGSFSQCQAPPWRLVRGAWCVHDLHSVACHSVLSVVCLHCCSTVSQLQTVQGAL